MKKIIASVLILACALTMLTGCCLKHDFTEPTCTEPAICKKCGETQGEKLGHEWEDATCTEPKTCSRCGKEKGDPLGHEWVYADCTHPDTCSRCGETRGTALGHSWTWATTDEPRHCTLCGETEGEPVSVTMLSNFWDDIDHTFLYNAIAPDGSLIIVLDERTSSEIILVAYDLNGSELFRLKASTFNAWSFNVLPHVILIATGSHSSFDTKIYDMSGNVIYTTTLQNVSGFPHFADPDSNGIAKLYNSGNDEALLYFDTISGKEVSADKYVGASLEHDKTKWSCYEIVPNSDNMFFVSTPDDSQWGFIDADGNVLAMYFDVSNFNKYGYALASNDRISYFIIDKDFNVVGDIPYAGDSAYVNCDDELIVLNTADGEQCFVIR